MAGTRRSSPRGVSAAVRLRKGALNEVDRIVADGLFEVGKQIVTTASAIAPDSPLEPYPLGEGLPKQGGVLVYVDGEKVDGWSTRGPQPKKPKAARIVVRKNYITVLVGFGFPALLVERGTIKTGAQPFLGPSRDVVAPRAAGMIAAVVRPRLGGNTP